MAKDHNETYMQSQTQITVERLLFILKKWGDISMDMLERSGGHVCWLTIKLILYRAFFLFSAVSMRHIRAYRNY